MENDGEDAQRGDHRPGRGTATTSNPEGIYNRNSRGGDVGCAFGSCPSDKGDDRCPVPEVPTTTQGTSHRSGCGDGGGVGRQAGGADTRSSADDWPNRMSDMVRF